MEILRHRYVMLTLANRLNILGWSDLGGNYMVRLFISVNISTNKLQYHQPDYVCFLLGMSTTSSQGL